MRAPPEKGEGAPAGPRRASQADHLGWLIASEHSLRTVQTQRLVRRFGLPVPTARAVAELCFGGRRAA